MRIKLSKLSLGLIFFTLGIASVLTLQWYSQKSQTRFIHPSRISSESKMRSLLDHFYDEDFFETSKDPFEQLRKMRKHMMQDFDETEDEMSVFDSWYKNKFGGGNAGEISKRVDSNHVYYDIAIKDLSKDKLSVKVENGQIVISGQIVKESSENGNHSFFTSHFHRTFPVPADVDPDSLQLNHTNEKLTLAFKKTPENH